MAVYKDGDKWRVIYRYTNYKGERKQTQKRGFATKREAVAWEHEVMLKSESKLDMTFASFFEIYEEDKKKRVKENTWESKSHVIRTKILPYVGERKIAEIEPKDVIAWQNELLAFKGENGEVYSPTYLKTIHAQLSAIFNHAIRYYHLPSIKVFDRNGVYLATKKIGKNNPKAEQIKADNQYRTMWNQTVDRALISGVPEAQILEVKLSEIGQKVKASIQKSGRNPALFKRIIITAIYA